MQWFAQAPSNIALIKYMGKTEVETNVPLNTSLSYTLENLVSSVSLELHMSAHDIWEPLVLPGYRPFTLTQEAQTRFLNHLLFLKERLQYTGTFIVRSCNNFPQASGLASSASSFAALTKCATLAISEQLGQPQLSIEAQAELSRRGSGSSCRSFFAPWALWSSKGVGPIDLPYQKLLHQAIIISDSEKVVPSSEAHLRIRTSPFYGGRALQAEEHMKLLLAALRASDWKSAYEVCWQEFHAMHALFSSCATPFTYITERTQEVLNWVQDVWMSQQDGPIVTMDAGPNVHLLYRPDQAKFAKQFRQDYLLGNYDVISF